MSQTETPALADALDPPIVTADLPGIGGRIKARPEDFVVEELPAYEADGTPDRHLMLTLTKRELNTADALREVARQLEVDVRDLGSAGLKDREAITTQTISVPVEGGERLADFEHPNITLGEPRPHSGKLRRGHLHGNRFTLVVRDLAVDPQEAAARVQAKLAVLEARHGFDNVYGPQRFGFEGRNLDKGMAIIEQGRRVRPGDLMLSAAQSGMFNLWVLMRRAAGLDRTLIAGDMVKKTDTGGMFTADDPATEQPRLDAGEIVITGPMFGGRMRGPRAGSESEAFEDEVLARAGLTRAQLSKLGRKAPGTRRELQISAKNVTVAPAPAVDATREGADSGAGADPTEHAGGLSPGLQVSFELPPGSYATVLLAELMRP